MLHVSHTDSSTHTVIAIEGHLSGECVPVLAQYCRERLANNRPLVLYLKNVSGVDDQGCDLLRQLLSQGVRLRATGVYIRRMVEELKRECAARAFKGGDESHCR